jgi:hypothetical protein
MIDVYSDCIEYIHCKSTQCTLSQCDNFQMVPQICISQVDVVAGGGAKEVPEIYVRYL